MRKSILSTILAIGAFAIYVTPSEVEAHYGGTSLLTCWAGPAPYYIPISVPRPGIGCTLTNVAGGTSQLWWHRTTFFCASPGCTVVNPVQTLTGIYPQHGSRRSRHVLAVVCGSGPRGPGFSVSSGYETYIFVWHGGELIEQIDDSGTAVDAVPYTGIYCPGGGTGAVAGEIP